jgi:signal transduction histidine kinase
VKSAELAANYARLSALEGERARSDERERLMRDMHDGIGGQLVQALAMTEHREDGADLAEVLRASLDDLRLLIDTSAHEGEDLGALLAGLRSRLRRRLEVAGLRVDWPLVAAPALPRLTPHRALQLVRVLQEAVANVLKHAQARTIRIECRLHATPDGAELQLEVADDGRGIAADAAPGRGLENMRRRAAELGGTLSISGGRGTRVLLRLPIE